MFTVEKYQIDSLAYIIFYFWYFSVNVYIDILLKISISLPEY